MNVTLCRLDQQQSSWMSHKRVLPEDERRELRMWMRRKQRESLAVYQKHRESLRERERKPFSTSGTTVSYVWLFARSYTPWCYFLKHHIHVFVPLLCLCRNQQTRIEQPFGELERKKKSMHFFTLSGYQRCPHVLTAIWFNRFMLLEQYEQRTREARALVGDSPSNPPARLNSSRTGGLPASSSTRSNSVPPPGGTQRYLQQQNMN